MLVSPGSRLDEDGHHYARPWRSDMSAVALAAALDSCECEIYTDVDGVYDGPQSVLTAQTRSRHL